MNVTLINGSPSTRSRSSALLEAVGMHLADAGHTIQRVALTDVPADDLIFARHDGPALSAVQSCIAQSDAVIVSTPVYKASLTGGLKALLDLLPKNAFANKPVLPLATGGSTAHLLALDFGLKPVLAALGAQHILTGVFATDHQVQFSDDGDVTIADDIRDRLEAGARALVEHLSLIDARRRPATIQFLLNASARSSHSLSDPLLSARCNA